MQIKRQRSAHTASLALLLFGFLAGPIVWSLHLEISEILISSACSQGTNGFSMLLIAGAPGWRVILLLVTFILVLIVLAADVMSLRAWRQTGTEASVIGTEGGAAGRSGWMAIAGVLVSTVFLIAIVFAGVPIFFLSGCK